jgi:hypothetical protein
MVFETYSYLSYIIHVLTMQGRLCEEEGVREERRGEEKRRVGWVRVTERVTERQRGGRQRGRIGGQ